MFFFFLFFSNNLRVVANDDCCSNMNNTSELKASRKEAAVRRARLKSISLDSDGARLCTDSCLPVEELIERTLPQTTLEDNDDDTPFHSPMKLATDVDLQQQSQNQSQQLQQHSTDEQNLKSTKNINRLVLDLSIKDDSLPHTESVDDTVNDNQIAVKTKLNTPKTPTLTQTRQKAISLDSDHEQRVCQSTQITNTISSEFGQTIHNNRNVTNSNRLAKVKPHLMPNFLCIESNASMSVPTTPKRQQVVAKTNKSNNKLNANTNINNNSSNNNHRNNHNHNNSNNNNNANTNAILSNSAKGGNMGNNRKSGFTSSAEYFSCKKAAIDSKRCMNENKFQIFQQLKSENEPIIEGNVIDDDEDDEDDDDEDDDDDDDDDHYEDIFALEHDNTGSFETSTDDVDCDIIGGSANSLISQYGNSGVSSQANSNIVSNKTGFRSNMSVAGLSLSNYSLSNFQGSHCSLTRSNYNIFGMTSAAATATGISGSGNTNFQTAHKSNPMIGCNPTTLNLSGNIAVSNKFFNSSSVQYPQSTANNSNIPW